MSGGLRVEIPVAWGDMDAFQHVNNTVYLRWFETARIAAFQASGWVAEMERTGVGPILARTTAVFRAPVSWPDTVAVTARLEDLGEDRFTMRYVVESARLGRVAAEGDARIVSYDYRAGTRAPLPPAIRDELVRLLS
ncbi:MAG TPA: thioesterase family protein [Myxococcota bacterium]|nr:thioesterase family protein [Myxococcota bacterium]